MGSSVIGMEQRIFEILIYEFSGGFAFKMGYISSRKIDCPSY